MQLGGIDNGHSADMHHVTNCIHPGGEHRQEIGGSAPVTGAALQTLQKTQEQQTAQFTLQGWLQKTLGSGKRLLGNFWGGSESGVSGQSGQEGQAQAQMLAQVLGSDTADTGRVAENVAAEIPQPDITQAAHTSRTVTAASAMVQPQPTQSNPYFSAIQDQGRHQETLWEKVRVHFKNVAGKLAGHLPGKFFNTFSAQTKSSFQARQERPREDLRRKSKYRKDELEIDCMLTDDSYLLDSYDRKGEYSKLTTEK